MYETALYIGRFQPFHNGHLRTLQKAMELAKRVVVGIGSDGVEMDYRNPWSSSERMGMIRGALPYNTPEGKVVFGFLQDYPYSNEEWANQVIALVQRYTLHNVYQHKTVMITGVKKDASSFYLDMFPMWDFVEGSLDEMMNGTDVRNSYFGGDPIEIWSAHLPESTKEFLLDYQTTERYRLFKQQRELTLLLNKKLAK